MNPFEEELKRRSTGNPFEDELSARQGQANQGPQIEYRGGVLPLTRYSDGSVNFDLDSGITGAIKRAFTLPGEVAKGEVDPTSDEGIARAREMGASVLPAPPVGRFAAAASKGARLPGKVKPKVPTSDELRAAAVPVYEQLDKAGTVFSAKSVDDLSSAIQNELLQKRAIGAEDAPKTFATLRNLQNAPEGATVPYATGLNTARKQFSKRSAGPDLNNPGDPAASAYAARRIMDFFERDGGNSVVSGPSVPTGLLKRANQNYAAAKRSETLIGKLDDAELRAAAANSGQNLGNAVRQRIAGLLTNKGSAKDRFGFNEGELQSLGKVVEGSTAANATRNAANFLGGGGGLGSMLTASIGGGAGAMAGGGLGAAIGAAIPVMAGKTLKSGSNALTKKALQKVDKATRMRSPLYEDLLAAAPQRQLPFDQTQALARAALIRAMYDRQNQEQVY
jgi:hypothetical protein